MERGEFSTYSVTNNYPPKKLLKSAKKQIKDVGKDFNFGFWSGIYILYRKVLRIKI